MAPTGSSTFSTRSTNSTERQTSTPAIRPMMHATHRVDKPAGSSDRNQAGQQTVARHGSVGLSVAQPHIEHGAEAARHSGKHRVDGHCRDAKVAGTRGPKRRTGIKSKPAKRQNEAAGQDDHDIVTDNRVRLTGARVLAKARPNDDRDGQSRLTPPRSAPRRNRRSPRSHCPGRNWSRGSRAIRPPSPIGEQRINKGAQEKGGDDESSELPAFGGRTGNDRSGRIHEDHLKQENHHHADVIRTAMRRRKPRWPKRPRSCRIA